MSNAIVIGAGISGLMHAKVLSKYFSSVTVLEKDSLCENMEPEHRKGLPQAHHQHILLMKGRELFEKIFPGFDAELAAMGSPELSYSNDIALYVGHGKLPRFPSFLKVRPSRRTWIDAIVRKRIASIPNINIQHNVHVHQLTIDTPLNRVTGVTCQRYQSEDSAQNTTFHLDADLVVDTSGRGSKVTKWLSEAGYGNVPSTVIDPKLGYASCLLKIPDDYEGAIRGIEVAPHAPDNPRAAGLWEVEKGKWLLTLIGMAGEYPSNDVAGFKQFAASLPTHAIHDVLASSERLSEIKSFRGTRNIWRHYEKMPRYPNGLLILGDALCAFNPLHGQGLTLIARSTQLLDKKMQSGQRNGYSQRWVKGLYRNMNKVFLSAWMFAISEDMRWPQTEGRKVDWKLNLAYRFTDKLLATSHHSEYVTKACLSVANMVRSPLTLIMPGILVRMAWYSFFSHKRAFKASALNESGTQK